MINPSKMQEYVLRLHHQKKPVTNSAIASLHGRASGKLSGQEISLKKASIKYWNLEQ